MSNIDFSKLTQEEIAKLSPEDFKAFTDYMVTLKDDSAKKDELIKAQAEEIKDAETVKSETQPTVTHTIGKEKVTVRVNLKKFQHLDDSTGMWGVKTLEDLKNDKTGPGLIEQLLNMDSRVVTRINLKKKKEDG